MRLFLLHIYFYFFQRTDSLECCIKNQKIEIKFVLKILFYTVFVSKLQTLHLFKSSRPAMFYKNFAKFTEKHLCRSLIQNNVAGDCFCSLSGTYKRYIFYPCSGISLIRSISFLSSFAVFGSSFRKFCIVFTLWS